MIQLRGWGIHSQMAIRFAVGCVALALKGGDSAPVSAGDAGLSGALPGRPTDSQALSLYGLASQQVPEPPPDAYPAFEASFAESGPSTYLVPLLPPAANAMGQQGFVRVINRSDERAFVRIDAFDDTGARRGRSILNIGANETVHFNTDDLEDGNVGKGVPNGVGPGEGYWRLQLFSLSNVEVLSYIRTEDGFLTSMHDVLPGSGGVMTAPIFNPGSNVHQVSRLRLINLGGTDAKVLVRGTDDAGETPGSGVEVAIPAGAAQTLSADDLESGSGLEGALGDGLGKWRLLVESEGLVVGMSLLESPTGHLTNLSTGPVEPYEHPAQKGLLLHSVPLFPATTDRLGRQGFVRVVNRSSVKATVTIDCFNGLGQGLIGNIKLGLAAGQAVNFNSDDLELGNPDKGLSEGIGSGPDSWRLMFKSFNPIEVYSYIRTRNGFLTSLHDFVPSAETRHHVAILNPGSNTEQVSRLRIVNPETESAEVRIRGIDGQGERSSAEFVTAIRGLAALDFTAEELESGTERADGVLGDGSAKWQLAIESDQFVQVMSVLESATTGIVTNLSTVPRRAADVVFRMPEMAGDGEAVGSPVTVEETGSGTVHSLEGPDADAFEIDAATGQIRTRRGVVYDHDTQPIYWLVVVVSEASGATARIGTRVHLTEVLELPGAPNPPTATSVARSSVRLLWAAPENPGPPITDYDYRYRLAGDGGDWIEYIGTAIPDTETVVTGLTANAEYEVQVRAVNSDGPGPWSHSAVVRVWPPAPDVSVSGPWAMVYANMVFDRQLEDFTSFCMTLALDTEIYGDMDIYIGLFGNNLNKIPIYGGLQTGIAGFSDKNTPEDELVSRGRGAIFSRWLERAGEAIRQGPGGLYASSAGEGDFISVRNDLAWSRGSYRWCLRKADQVPGEPLPDDYSAEDISHSWGRYVHTWVRMEVTDLATRKVTWVGSLAFPGKTLSLNDLNIIFVEAYGRNSIGVRQVPYFELSVRDLQIDGEDAHYRELVEIANPGRTHTNAPVIAKTTYNRSEREFAIRVGAFTGDFGTIERELFP